MKKNDYNMAIMDKLVTKKSLRDAVKWLDTSLGSTNKTPAQLMKEGRGDIVLNQINSKKGF